MRGPSSGMGSMAGNMGGLSGVMIMITRLVVDRDKPGIQIWNYEVMGMTQGYQL